MAEFLTRRFRDGSRNNPGTRLDREMGGCWIRVVIQGRRVPMAYLTTSNRASDIQFGYFYLGMREEVGLRVWLLSVWNHWFSVDTS